MANESARGLVLPVSILVAVAVGVVIGVTVARPAASAPSAQLSAEPSAELSTTLRALTTELERMRQSASTLSVSAPQPTRTEAGPTVGDDVARQIDEASRRLTAALDQMRATAASFSADLRPLVVPSAPPDLALLEKLTTSGDYSATARKYQLWTYQEVLDRFGAPSSVQRWETGVQWMYEFPPDNNATFLFIDGRVVGLIY